MFNIEHGDIRGKMKIESSKLTGLQVDPAGLYLSVSTGSKVILYQLATGLKVYEF